jgi:hypothetical protein
MRIAIMQPYFFPYIGYFQLINAVDKFVVYDNIEFTKKGWINRNRILVNGKDAYITLPLKKDSDYLHVKQRALASNWQEERKKLLNRVTESYRKAPFFEPGFTLIEKCVMFNSDNLFEFIKHSLEQVTGFLGIKTPFVISSEIAVDHSLKSEQKVMAICKALQAGSYLNPIGGLELYDKNRFKDQGFELDFLKSGEIRYKQFAKDFVSNLSIIDVVMFNSRETITGYLTDYTLL